MSSPGQRSQELRKLPIELCIERRPYVDKLIEWGALPNKRQCTEELCGRAMRLKTDIRALDGISWNCTNRQRNERNKRKNSFRMSVRTSSFFEGSHLSLEQIVVIVRGWSDRVRQNLIAKKVGVSKNTLIVWANVCRDVATDYCIANSKILGGPGRTVDIDLLYGKKKFDTVQHLMLCGLERETGDFFIATVCERKVSKVATTVYKWIRQGTTIVSGLWKEFSSLSNDGLKKWKIQYCVKFVDPVETRAKNITDTWWHRKHRTPCKLHQDSLVGYFAQFAFLEKCKRLDIDPVIEFLRAENKTYAPNKESYPDLGSKPNIKEIGKKLRNAVSSLDLLVAARKSAEEIEAVRKSIRNLKAEYKIATGEDMILPSTGEEILVTPILPGNEDGSASESEGEGGSTPDAAPAVAAAADESDVAKNGVGGEGSEEILTTIKIEANS